MYISHARNIATGHPYNATGYIYNPASPGLGPRAYPPVFPLLLSPLYLIWGLRFTPMKLEVVAFFAAALVASYHLFKRELTAFSSVALILLLGLSPFFWDFKDNVLSDIPFLFFVLVTLILIRRSTRERPVTFVWRSGLVIGVASWAASGTRTVGVVLIPVLLIVELVSVRKLTARFWAALASFGSLVAIQALVFGGGQGSYLDQLKPSLSTISSNVRAVPLELQELWGNGHSHAAMLALFFVFGALAITGFVVKVRRGLTVVEIFPIVYSVAILIWPSLQGTRFWIPVIPFYLFFALVGAERLGAIFGKRRAWPAVAVLLAAAVLSYGARYATFDHGPIPVGMDRPDTIRFFRFVSTRTKPRAVFIFRRPRALALFTGRPAAVYARLPDFDTEWAFFESIHAAYIGVGPEDGRYLSRLLERHARNVQEIYREGHFRVYRIVSYR